MGNPLSILIFPFSNLFEPNPSNLSRALVACNYTTLEDANSPCQFPLLLCHLHKMSDYSSFRMETFLEEEVQTLVKALFIRKSLEPNVAKPKDFVESGTGKMINGTCSLEHHDWGIDAQSTYETLFGPGPMMPLEELELTVKPIEFRKENAAEFIDQMLTDLDSNQFIGFLDGLFTVLDRRLEALGVNRRVLLLYWNIWPDGENNLPSVKDHVSTKYDGHSLKFVL